MLIELKELIDDAIRKAAALLIENDILKDKVAELEEKNAALEAALSGATGADGADEPDGANEPDQESGDDDLLLSSPQPSYSDLSNIEFDYVYDITHCHTKRIITEGGRPTQTVLGALDDFTVLDFMYPPLRVSLYKNVINIVSGDLRIIYSYMPMRENYLVTPHIDVLFRQDKAQDYKSVAQFTVGGIGDDRCVIANVENHKSAIYSPSFKAWKRLVEFRQVLCRPNGPKGPKGSKGPNSPQEVNRVPDFKETSIKLGDVASVRWGTTRNKIITVSYMGKNIIYVEEDTSVKVVLNGAAVDLWCNELTI